MTSAASSAYPVLVMRDTVLFPGVLLPVSVGRASSAAAVEAAAATAEKLLVVACQAEPNIEEPSLADLYPIATRAVVKRLEHVGDYLRVVVEGIDRVALLEPVQQTPHIVARIDVQPVLVDGDPHADALQREVMALATAIAEFGPPDSQVGMQRIIADTRDPVRQAYMLAAAIGLEPRQTMDMLAARSRKELLTLLHAALLHERNVLELRKKIAAQAQFEMNQEQRQQLLRQQLRAIQHELGEDDSERAAVTDLGQRLEKAGLPEVVRTEAARELRRLGRLPPASPDHQLTRTWLELVLDLPWNAMTEDRIDLEHARAVLDEDHAGLEKVKERILEHLAVMKLNPAARAPILCLVGPPGVGKTSLGKSIARAIGRAFERLSLGGVHDEAELRGHRRTYIGAMPGRLVQAIRRAKVKNPLLMLDEIDKLGAGVHGDPSAALLEVLDPAQNSEFRDNYLDLPFDLSRVFFITTANMLEPIPTPLRDRMEVIRLSGYTEDEKVEIGRRYLLPRQRADCGLRVDQLQVDEPALRAVIRRYTREAGVRQLERVLGALCRKAAARIAAGTAQAVVASAESLGGLLGPPRFSEDEIRADLEPGVAAGLAWTEAGGAVLWVEAVKLPGSRELLLTGQLGEVMRESARAALSWLSSRGPALGIDPAAMNCGVHVHIPAGATPKDGPSAGVTMATTLASLFSGHPVRNDLAMSGEITLSGLVLPVGGIKEKLLAAHRAGMRTVILPRANQRDLEEIPANVRAGVEIVWVQRVADVLAVAIPALARPLAETGVQPQLSVRPPESAAAEGTL